VPIATVLKKYIENIDLKRA
jgi:hypothetical protein